MTEDMSDASAKRAETMSHECELGFAELYQMAHDRAWTAEEERSFGALGQEARNAMVRELALKAGGIRTADRIGTDGVTYTAFWIDRESDARSEEPAP
jgi:hypothetical protein